MGATFPGPNENLTYEQESKRLNCIKFGVHQVFVATYTHLGDKTDLQQSFTASSRLVGLEIFH